YGLRLRHAQHGSGERIGDLVFDHLRRLTGKLRVDDHLHVGEVGNGVERHPQHGVDSGKREKQRRKTHQKTVAGRPADDAADHRGLSGEKVFSAASRLLSESIRKVAVVTTSSPSRTPSSTSQ